MAVTNPIYFVASGANMVATSVAAEELLRTFKGSKITQVNNAAGYDAAATAIVVDDADNIDAGDTVFIGDERVKVVSKNLLTLTVERAQDGTVAAAIGDDAEIHKVRDVAITGTDQIGFARTDLSTLANALANRDRTVSLVVDHDPYALRVRHHGRTVHSP